MTPKPVQDAAWSASFHSSRAAAWAAGLVVLGMVAAAVPPLAVPAFVLTLIGALAFPTLGGSAIPKLGYAAIAVAAVGSTVGVGRFVLSGGMRGMVTGGQSVATHSALWKLREIVIAEDALRRAAPWDPDGDHVGSAALVGTLAGTLPLRGGRRLDPPLLGSAFQRSVDTPLGPATRIEGYLFIVCLPSPGGGLTARPEDAIDEELAERRYVAYAWPSDAGAGMSVVFFADEHERLLVLEPPAGAPAPYFGAQRPPACDAALGANAAGWTAWKNKKPREKLPGDG